MRSSVQPAVEIRDLSFSYDHTDGERGGQSPSPSSGARGDTPPPLASAAPESLPPPLAPAAPKTPPPPPAPALDGIDLKVWPGEMVVFLGPSGCGKTTLCRCITGVIPHVIAGTLSGETRVNGRVITRDDGSRLGELARETGLVLQEPDHQIVMTTVEDDVAFGPENLMRPPDEIRATVDRVIAEVGLSSRESQSPRELSGGEKQRLAIAGVLAMRPSIIIFDEPTSGLDRAGKQRFIAIVRELVLRGATVLIVEHDYEFLDFADRWVLMREGRILADAAPSDVPPGLLEDELWR